MANSVSTKSGPAAMALVKALQGGEIELLEDRKTTAARMALRTLQADTLDDVLEESKTDSGADLLGMELTITGWVMRESQLEDTNVYMVIEAVETKNGRPHAITTGSPKVMAQMARVKDLDGFPLGSVEFYEMGQGKPGESAPLGIRRFTNKV